MTVSRPRPAKLVIREVGVGGERVRNYQVEQDDLDDLSQEELGVRARAILGRKPTALESDKGPANVRNSSETQASPSVPVKTEEKSPMTDEKSPVTDEKSPVPVSTDGEIRASEEKPSIVAEEEELVENTYSKFKVKVVSGRYLAEVHVNDKVVSVMTSYIHVCAQMGNVCTNIAALCVTTSLFCIAVGFSHYTVVALYVCVHKCVCVCVCTSLCVCVCVFVLVHEVVCVKRQAGAVGVVFVESQH